METSPMIAERERRTAWFREARFGMFIHWGLYAIPARGEWVRNRERISKEEYRRYFDEFDPANYNPKEWAKAAKAAGMKYAVLTAKHHDGFCLFDSALTEYKSTRTRAGRDLVREFLDAFREEGLRVGLYYSLLDWYHDDYPHYGDRHHPMRDNEDYREKRHDFPRYVDYLHGQVRELLTKYGTIDIMWFDFSYGEMSGETWRATELMRTVRELAPDIIVDNRLDASGEEGGSIKSENPPIYAGDFASPEQIIPPEGVLDHAGRPIPWEACITLNNNWGYAAADKTYKTPKTIIRKLVECVSKNGNMLLNVGPNAKGEIPRESLDILAEVGDWMRANGESIHGCRRAELPKPEWGRYTCKDGKLYAHVLEENIGPVNLKGLAGKVRRARLLADGSELRVARPWSAAQYKEDAFVSFAEPSHYTYPLPDERDTVIELELED